jgi:hypothetical protein
MTSSEVASRSPNLREPTACPLRQLRRGIRPSTVHQHSPGPWPCWPLARSRRHRSWTGSKRHQAETQRTTSRCRDLGASRARLVRGFEHPRDRTRKSPRLHHRRCCRIRAGVARPVLILAQSPPRSRARPRQRPRSMQGPYEGDPRSSSQHVIGRLRVHAETTPGRRGHGRTVAQSCSGGDRDVNGCGARLERSLTARAPQGDPRAAMGSQERMMAASPTALRAMAIHPHRLTRDAVARCVVRWCDECGSTAEMHVEAETVPRDEGRSASDSPTRACVQ